MKHFFSVLALTVGMTGLLAAAPVNVALNKTVTLQGTFGNSTAGTPIVWTDPVPADASTVVDGTFLASGTNWQQGLWWHEHDTQGTRYIEIDLGSTYDLIGGIIQADNNDPYLIEYRDAAMTWQTLWSVPVSCCDGVTTRPNNANTAELFPFGAPVNAQFVRVSASAGDRYYAVTELQLFAEESAAVPEPSSLLLSAAGMLACAGIARLRRQSAR